MSAVDYIARHAGGVDDECTSGHLPRHDLTAAIMRDLINPTGCHRCSNGTGPTCDPCAAEIQMREDDESHAAECAMHEARWTALADDEADEWGDLP